MLFRTSIRQGLLLTGLVGVSTAAAQTQRDEQFYYPGAFNWEFLATYPEAARLFNAFDYGHAVLYERLYTRRGRAGPELEKEYRYLTTNLLVRPPRFAVAEEVIMPSYAKVAWRAKLMFDWAHLLHRQIYDVYADDRLTAVQRDRLIEQLTDYYLSNRKYAFTEKPKSMALMDEQYFSQAFRRAYPKFNGLIWSYHWLQVGLYEPFLEGNAKADIKAGVQATMARFWSMLEAPPSSMPKTMPMTSAIAPKFSAAHPRAAVIFDNLHMMHDIISDILTADTIPHERKGEVINQQLDKLQDPSRDVMSLDEWRMMAEHMGGVDAMGGPATDLLRAVQPPTAAMGDHGRMAHDMEHMNRDRNGAAPDTLPRGGAGMKHGEADTAHHAMAAHMAAMMELHARMMADSVIRHRVMADPEMRRLMAQMMDSVQMGHGQMGGVRKPDAQRHDKGQHEKHPAKPVVPSRRDTKPPKGRNPEQPAKPPAPSDSAHHHQGHSFRVAPSRDIAAGGPGELVALT